MTTLVNRFGGRLSSATDGMKREILDAIKGVLEEYDLEMHLDEYEPYVSNVTHNLAKRYHGYETLGEAGDK